MKLSKYTIFHEQGNKAYIFHQTSNALLNIDGELETALKGGNLQSVPSDIIALLEKNGFSWQMTLTKLAICVMQTW